ncbi:hypothetical protein BDV59DRAFT_175509 [Aspergillus ambiguus]|uniref:uncharacterized protein n=1 Tax=Aspergillus ambiguus TaxID=176160 RepID=UPI003CCD7CA9
MSWTQVSPIRYERPFDSIEQFYRTVAAAGAPLNKEHYLITCTVRLQSPLPPVHAVEQAWKALRHVYPQLAAEPEIGGGERFAYDVLTSATELNAWTRATFHVEPDRSADDLYEQLAPSPRFHLYYLLGTSELVFRTPHWRIDGIGLLHLQSAFLQLLADGTKPILDGTEPSRLCPSLDAVVAGISPAPASSLAATAAAADEELQPFLYEGRTLTLPTLPNILPTTPKRLLRSIDSGTTDRLLSACSTRKITVTAAAHAALALAARQFSLTPQQEQQDYVGFNAIDLRRYLPVPWNGPDAAISLYHTGLPFRMPLHPSSPACIGSAEAETAATTTTALRETEFVRLANAFTSLYRRDLAQETPRNVFGFLPAYVDKVMQVLSRAPTDPRQGPAHPELSSMGKLNELLATEVKGTERTLRVAEWWVAVEVINRLLLTNVWTWDHQLVLSVNWNEAFYERELVEGLFGRWREELVMGLIGE